MQAECRLIAVDFPSRPIALMRVAGLTPFIAHLVRSGLPADGLLARAHLPLRLLDQPESLMPAAQAIRFMEDAARARGLDDLGLRAGLGTPIHTLGLFGRLVGAAGTLGGAVDAFVRLASDFDSSSRWWTVRDGEHAWLCHELTVNTCASYRQADQYWLGIALSLLRAAAGHGWRPDEIRLQTTEPRGFGQIDAVAGTRVAFSQTETAIGFPGIAMEPFASAPTHGAAARSP